MALASLRRYYVLFAVILAALTVGLLYRDGLRASAQSYIDRIKHQGNNSPPNKDEPSKPAEPPRKYLPKPEWSPPPISDPFPLLSTSLPPPIPSWNVPEPDLHLRYNLTYAPPLLVGFTRSWPMLLQTVVSYITAGWPPSQIHVVENTGTQLSNLRGELTLQNPFYLNHTQLHMLGVNVVQTPVLMSFAQLQNFYIHLSHAHAWPQYFWSHMDVLAMSYEDGGGGITERVGEKGYKTIYELSLKTLRDALDSKQRWSHKLFAYDHLTLINREAYDDIGGWDTLIPYYMTDCDTYTRLDQKKWKVEDARAGIVFDVASVLKDFRAFYRIEGVEVDFVDPNPPAPEDKRERRGVFGEKDLEYWDRIRRTGEHMDRVKHERKEGRNTWQLGQQGGQGEPYYYHSRGIAEGIEVLTDAGKEVFARKWGHRGCDIGSYKFSDQWIVEKDY